jgi:hypothetical protein
MGERDDFVRVRLTEAGAARGGVRVLGANYDYDFRPGAELELTRAECLARCADEIAAGLLELIPF